MSGSAIAPSGSVKREAEGMTPSLNGGSSSSTSGGGGGGYGGGSSGPTDDDRKAQANLGGISGFNFQTPQIMVGLGDKMMDNSDAGNANIRDYAIKNARRKGTSEWYKGQQDLQSVVSQLADASGNLMNGSGFLDFNDLIARRDDQQDVEVLNTEHENEAAAWQDFYEALQQNNNARNQMYIDAQEAMRSVGADYVAQSNNIHPDLAGGMIDTDNHNLTLPDWLNSDGFADNRMRGPVEPVMQDFYRPAMDAKTATDRNLVDREPTTVNQASTNKSYWERMRSGYGRRNQ